MQSIAIKKTALRNSILGLSDQEIDLLDKFIKELLARKSLKKSRPLTLEGIWKDKGFDKIKDIESEIGQIRAEIGNSILNREF